MITALIIDDEESSLENLSHLIKEYCKNVSIIGSATSVNTALELIKVHKPNVLFLDINMPNGGGFGLLSKLNEKPLIVFVTAYANFAIKAIKEQAFDYILKPIDIDDLQLCVERLIEHVMARNENIHNGHKGKLKISDAHGIHLVDIESILYLEADNNYTIIHIDAGSSNKFVVSRTMGEFESTLPNDLFFRIHKSYIINVEKMKKYHKEDGAFVVMNNNTIIEISRRKTSHFRQFLNERYGF